MILLLLQTNQWIVAAGKLIFDSINHFSSMTFSIKRKLYSCKVWLQSYVQICKHTHPTNVNITKAASSEVTFYIQLHSLWCSFHTSDNTYCTHQTASSHKRLEEDTKNNLHTPFNESQKLHSNLLWPNFMVNSRTRFQSRTVNTCTKCYQDLVS
jgi:hypothetical protein